MNKQSLHIGKSSETSYLGGDITIDKDGLYTYLFGGGYCEFKPYAAYADSIKYYYYTKDHLGNIRNVIAKNGNGQMEEQNNNAKGLLHRKIKIEINEKYKNHYCNLNYCIVCMFVRP